MATDSSALFGDLGGAASSLFGAIGSQQSAGAYDKAAQIAEQQAKIQEQSTAIQETQKQRQIYQTISGEQADVAGAGLANSGTAQDLLRSSVSQGALSKAAIQAQGLITETGFQQQAAAYHGMSQAASSASTGGFLSTAMNLVGAAAMFL